MTFKTLLTLLSAVAISAALFCAPLFAQRNDAPGDGLRQPNVRPGQPGDRPFSPFRGQPAHLLGVDLRDKVFTIELQPAAGTVYVSDNTVYVRNGELVELTGLNEQAEIVAVYSPAVSVNAAAIVQLTRDQPTIALRGVVRRMDGEKLILRDAPLDSVDVSEAVVVDGGKAVEMADLKAEDAVIVVVTGPTAFDQKGLLVLKVDRDDTSLNSLKARVAQTPRPMRQGFPGRIEVAAGRPKEIDMRYADDIVMWTYGMRHPSQPQDPLTPGALKERIDQAGAGAPVTIRVEFEPAANGETPLLKYLMLHTMPAGRGGFREPQAVPGRIQGDDPQPEPQVMRPRQDAPQLRPRQ